MKNHDNTWNPSEQPTFWINHASRLLMRDFEARLRPLGFGMAYLPVITALEENGPLQQKQLVELIDVEQPTMAALLSRMERDGVVVRTPHPHDRRSSRFELSVTTRQRVPEAKQVLTEIAEAAVRGFSPDERSALLSALRRVAVNLGEMRVKHPSAPAAESDSNS
ncbi:MarR family winged helix-turn-helix transcriptional regulator [Klebsiella sp. NPDC088457]|uniref:MarR family winged helix-turn-helix transcriptional regulator n=1 Tax=Raoultella sp. BIGb0138 TaxID=2485115 RepID=UPI00105010C1|nr:MarR family transcriptional regulator [Raoultella sp. BIGb0138]